MLIVKTNLPQLLQQQDPNAISQLYDAYGSALFGIVLRIVSNRQTAQQVLQDTFVKAWRNGANYDPSKGEVFTWLLNIARNTAIDATRTAYYRNQVNSIEIDALAQTPGGEATNPDTFGLKELVQKMDVKHALLIDMVYFKGYTQQEISDETGIPLGTVKTRLRAAIMDLRGCLA
jgi:RNA polymerase sigma-70 factor, ECF subfamily